MGFAETKTPPIQQPQHSTTVIIDGTTDYGRATACRFSSDCGSGQTCRDGVCMGGSRPGLPCRFSTDCAGAMTCRDRGDGYEVCMGNGRRGDPCLFGTECEGSLFCRSHGAFKTCQ